MIIQIILAVALLLSISYAFTQRNKSRFIANIIFVTAIGGLFLVLFPGYSSVLAGYVGVGRGADLVFYCWIAISFLVSVNLQFRILGLQQDIVKLTRALAIHTARVPEGS
jgi:small membrane protein